MRRMPSSPPDQTPALGDAENYHRLLVESIEESFYLVEVLRDANDQPVDVLYLVENPAAVRTVGISAKGRTLRDVNPAFDREWLVILDRVVRTGASERFERFSPITGLWHDYRVFAVDREKRQVGVLSSDISEQKAARDALRQSEAAFRASEEQLRRVLDGMGEGFGLLAPDFTILEHNREALRMDGRARDEIVGRSHWDVFPGSEDVELGRLLKKAMAERVPVSLEHQYAWEAGRALWLEMRAYPMADGGLAVFWRDVTDRKQAEQALRESETRFRAVFETMIEACCIFEMIYDDFGKPVDWRILEANAGYERESGLKDVAGKLASEVMPGTEAYWTETFGRVAETGEPEQIEQWHQPTGRWVHSSTARIGGPESRRLVSVFYDITERKRAEIALRESERSLAHEVEDAQVLQSLSNQLVSDLANGHHQHIVEAARALMRSDAASIQQFDPTSSRLKLVAHVGFHPDSAAFWDWVDASSGSVCGSALAARNRVAVADTGRLEAGPSELKAFQQSGIVSVQSTPLVARSGQIVGMISTHWCKPHLPGEESYKSFDVLARLAADFIERTRAETALRESEERFRQFAAASSGALWIRDAETLRMEYVSPAMATVYGVEPDFFLNGVTSWAALIVPDDRAAALEHIERARKGESVVHEFRIQRPSDLAFRWIRDTNFPLHDAQGRIHRVGGIAEDVSEARLAVEHQEVLLAELQHRVRNIMAVIRAMAARTAATARSVEDYAALMHGRLTALARTQALLTRAANVGVEVAEIVRTELAAQTAAPEQFSVDGQRLVISPKAAEVLSLAVHELTTNALKYGALSVPDGRVTVNWRVAPRKQTPWLILAWKETRSPPPDSSTPRRRGFGSELIEQRAPYELGGSGTLSFKPDGVEASITFPLQPGGSILETDAPPRERVFGGSIDMSGEADLTGKKVLILEDDYFIASDTARALQGAGADVVGPFPNEREALSAIKMARPDAALVDINLGEGASFESAAALSAKGVPFVFLTGYDQQIIPETYKDVQRFEKPVDLRQVVRAVAGLL